MAKRTKHSKEPAQKKPPTSFVPSFGSGHLPADEDVARFRSLVAPHVDSFNFFLDVGLAAGINDIEPIEIDLIDPKVYRDAPETIDLSETASVQFWIEKVRIHKPTKTTGKEMMGTSSKLLPRECRERKLMVSFI
jgi:DNA-directed RNA polymerase beta subunit